MLNVKLLVKHLEEVKDNLENNRLDEDIEELSVIINELKLTKEYKKSEKEK